MTLTITTDGYTTTDLTVTDEQVNHACSHFEDVLTERPHMRTNLMATHMYCMALCLGHAIEGGTGQAWSERTYQPNTPAGADRFSPEQAEVHLLLGILIGAVYDAAGWEHPADMELRLMLLGIMVDVVDEEAAAKPSGD